MHKLTILCLLVLSGSLCRSQNIFTALHLNADREYKTRKPEKITETNTFITKTGRQVDKNIKYFDNSGMLVTEERYDQNGGLKARLTYENDTVNRIKLSRTMERWTQFGYSRETAFYTYDSNYFLVGITDRDATGNVFQQANIVCNQKGHPIKLTLYDGNGNTYGQETAQYLYDKNRAVNSVFANDGRLLSRDTIKISFISASEYPADGEVYNANGDLIHWTSKSPNGSETIFEEEHEYDSFGNCTETKIFKISIQGNGRQKRELDRIFRKKYHYR